MDIPKIKAAIKEAADAQMIRTTVTADKLIAELANIAFSRPTAVMTWGPDGVILKDSSQLSADDVALVSEVSETKGTDKGGGSMKVKLHDKMKALELLGKHLGIFQDISRVQVQEMPDATPTEHKQFQEVANRALDRWKTQGFLNAPKAT
jgi:phage terminase small subunit